MLHRLVFISQSAPVVSGALVLVELPASTAPTAGAAVGRRVGARVGPLVISSSLVPSKSTDGVDVDTAGSSGAVVGDAVVWAALVATPVVGATDNDAVLLTAATVVLSSVVLVEQLTALENPLNAQHLDTNFAILSSSSSHRFCGLPAAASHAEFVPGAWHGFAVVVAAVVVHGDAHWVQEGVEQHTSSIKHGSKSSSGEDVTEATGSEGVVAAMTVVVLGVVSVVHCGQSEILQAGLAQQNAPSHKPSSSGLSAVVVTGTSVTPTTVEGIDEVARATTVAGIDEVARAARVDNTAASSSASLSVVAATS